MKRKHKATFGSVSHGTMRSEDLIPAFSDALRWIRGSIPASLHRAIRAYDAGKLGEDDVPELVNSLFDALNEYAPAYGYFGANEGDGSDYGFWLSSDWQQNAEDDGALIVSDTGEVPRDYSGEVVHVNDHGNATLYVSRRGKLREVWAVV